MTGISAKRRSKQREIVLALLRSGGLHHPTASEVYEAARVQMPNISLGTVYRNLSELARDGAILKLDASGDSSARFDADTAEHAHFACKKCGKIYDAPLAPELRKKLSKIFGAGFSVETSELLFSGRCPNCVRKIKIKINGNRL